MDLDGLTGAQRKLYREAVAGSHHRAVELVILTRDGVPVRSLTNRFLGGSIQGDESRTPATFAEFEVFDEDHLLNWAHGEHRKFLAQIVDSRFVPALNGWVDDTVHTGPIWDFERNGAAVRMVVEGFEKLAEGSIREADHWPAKTKATDVLKALLKRAGAQAADMRIPDMKATLPRDVTVGVRPGKAKDDDGKKSKRPKRQVYKVSQEDTYFTEAESIAEALDRDLFTSGDGKFIMAAPRTRPSIRLTYRTMVAPVTENRGDDGEVTNTWIGLGANPKGPRKRVTDRIGLPRRHPASARSQAWNTVPRQIIERIENPHWRTKKAVRAVLMRRRDRAMRETTRYEVSALPVMTWIRPNMLASIPTSGGRTSARVPRWTLPLGPGADPMTLGANRPRGWQR